jgi:hypothetical protein
MKKECVVHAESRERNGELRYEACPPLGRNFCLVGNPQHAEVPINRASFFRCKDFREFRIRIAPIFDSIVEEREQVATEVSNTQRIIRTFKSARGHHIAVSGDKVVLSTFRIELRGTQIPLR